MLENFRAKSRLGPWLCCCVLTLGFSFTLMAQSAANVPPARIFVKRPVEASRMRTLAGNTRAEANAGNDRGRVSAVFPMQHMLLQLQRSPEREQALRAFIDQQHDSTSPHFHAWLTAAEFGQTYGPAAQDIDAVCDWLRSAGLAVNTVYPSGMLIDFSGTAGQVSAAFGTEIHRLSVNGKAHIANMSDPQIPEALAEVVVGVVSLHDFRPHSMKKARANYRIEHQLVVPGDLATIYDLNAAFAAGYTGKGQTIAVVENSDLYNTADWNTFRKVFGLATYTSGSLTTLNPAPPSGKTNCSDPGSSGADDEASLDAEWSSAAAPDAAIQVAACDNTSTTPGFVIAMQNLINSRKPPQIISVSYGYCEAGTGVAANASYNASYQQAVAEGVSVFVASGDEGAASCDADLSTATHGIGVDSTASTPYNVAVGGTDFADSSQGTTSTYWGSSNSTTYASALSYVPEIPWNDSCASSVLATYLGYQVSYGTSGYCGSSRAEQNGNLTTAAGSGGPSGCATGVPAANLVVGGTCKGYAKPSWQSGVAGIPNDGVRDLPDVALFAANGVWGHYYVYCFSDPLEGAPCEGSPGNWAGAGGTSFGAPILAGIQALVNQKMGGPQGNPNPVYYKLAASSVSASVFHSITTGDIVVNCSGEINCFGAGFEGRGRATPATQFAGNGGLSTSSHSYDAAFAAGSGWNFATGLGSVDAYNLIMNWSKGQ
ncbi:MAG TPA: S53 family peptidase [Bryobacteraceae bacterium]|nr:S53 family peptidase [Bryobacteraceae bacterium]